MNRTTGRACPAPAAVVRQSLARPLLLTGLLLGLAWGGAALYASLAPAARDAAAGVPAPLLAAVHPGPLAPEGTYAIQVWRDGAWQPAAGLGADRFNRTQLALLHGLPAEGELRLRIEKRGGGGAHLDAVSLAGRAPVAVNGAPLAKLRSADNDIAPAHTGPIELTFARGPGLSAESALLRLTGRIEPVQIGTEPFRFPVANAFRQIGPESKFFSYRLGDRPGALALDGELTGERLGTPLFDGWFPVGSGHPQGLTYGWVMNDGETLYVALDFTPDNTMDGDVDYATLHVNTPAGVRAFTATVNDTRWGRPGFTYTERAAYQHKVYEFAIPLAELGIDPAAPPAAPLQVAFSAYGTAAPGYYSTALAFDSVENCFLAEAQNFFADGSNLGADVRLYGEAGTPIGGFENIYGSDNGIASTPAVAFDPTTGRYLVIVNDRDGTGATPIFVRARLLEGDGTPVSAAFSVTEDTDNTFTPRAAVAANTQDGGYLVVWPRGDQSYGAIHGRLINADGTPNGTSFGIDDDGGFPRAAYDPTNNRFLVVFLRIGEGDLILGRLIEPNGSVGASITIDNLVSNGATPDVSFDAVNDRFLVVWEDSGNVYGAMRNANGSEFKATFGIATNVATQPNEKPAVAHDPVNGGYLVAWNSTSISEDIRAQAIDDEGNFAGGAQGLAVLENEDEDSPALAANAINGGIFVSYVLDTASDDPVIDSTFIGSLSGSAGRALPPGTGWALLGLAGLAALLWLGQRARPRLRPAFRAAALATALHLLVLGGLVACSDSGGGGGGGDNGAPATCQLAE